MATYKLGVVGDSFWTAYGSGVYISTVITSYLTGLGHTASAVNRAVSGTSSVDWQTTGSYWPGALAAFSDGGVTDLIYAVGINDSQDGVATTASDYQTNVQGVITSAKAGISTLQRIHLIAPSYPTPGYGPTWTSSSPPRAVTYGTTQTTLAGLNAITYALGRTIYATLRDTVSYRLSSSDLHPSSTGATWIGNTLGAEIVAIAPTTPQDLYEAVVAHIKADTACAALLTGGINSNLAYQGSLTAGPIAVLTDQGTTAVNFTAANGGTPTSRTDDGILQIRCTATSRRTSKQCGDAVADALNDATLTFADGSLNYLRESGRRNDRDPDPGPNGSPVWNEYRDFRYVTTKEL